MSRHRLESFSGSLRGLVYENHLHQMIRNDSGGQFGGPTVLKGIVHHDQLNRHQRIESISEWWTGMVFFNQYSGKFDRVKILDADPTRLTAQPRYRVMSYAIEDHEDTEWRVGEWPK